MTRPVELRVLEDPARLGRAAREFRRTLARRASKRFRRHAIGFPGETMHATVHWFGDHDFFACFEDLENRACNFFGVVAPTGRNTLPVTVEVNIPRSGRDARIGGLMLEDVRTGEVFIGHRGKIGGGRAGIGRTGFRDAYPSWKVVEDGVRESEVVVVAPLRHDDLIVELATFVHEVQRIKAELVGHGGVPRLPEAFAPEFEGHRRTPGPISTVAAEVRHGTVVRALRDALARPGRTLVNDRHRDLVAVERGRPTYLYEVKTETSMSSVYGAIGQLLVQGHAQRGGPRLALVLPERPTRRFARVLARLEIAVVTYAWNEGAPTFRGLP